MWCLIVFCAAVIAPAIAEENCDVSRYTECMEPIHNATFGHPNGLFQDSNDLVKKTIKEGIKCIQDFVKDCGTDMIAENYHEQFEKPAEFLDKICDPSSPLRTEYLKASPCLQEKSDDLEVCSTKVQEFLSILDEADSNEKELTLTCMYEMMLRACLLSTSGEKCGLETASFIRKALLYSPSLGMQTCSKEVPYPPTLRVPYPNHPELLDDAKPEALFIELPDLELYDWGRQYCKGLRINFPQIFNEDRMLQELCKNIKQG
ncbi:HSF_DOMAIN domain-containing protein [Caerostris extrusa]|uniref:HSF_DOMAIN domain-containing protein n=1 Tax=Caerostris extrusa TaxID=172846 RepID=A0AAV4UPR7_CAEEX|nr:HSF_DOMAIN domain-containing protein [Caerostris extrusa]